MLSRFTKSHSLPLLLAFCLVLSLFAPSLPAMAKDKDTLVVALDAEPLKLDPHTQNLTQAYQVQELVFDNLIKKDNDGNFQPSVAKEWELVDDTTIVFKLRDDVYFHNGQQLTAKDVVFTIKRATEGSNSRSLFKDFDPENTKALDDFTVEVKLYQPCAPAFVYLSSPRAHLLSEEIFTEMGEDAHGRAPVGSGPFVFDQWVLGDRILMKRNDAYWGEKPEYANLTLRVIPDSSIRAIELESGGVDIIYTIGPEDYYRLNDDPGVVTLAGPGFTHEILQMSMRADEFADKRIREALTYALDTTAIVKAVYGDLADVADSIFSSQIFGHTKIGPRQRDLERAKQLVIDAGYPDGFKTRIAVADNRETLNMLEIAQAMWKEANIEVSIDIYDQATIREKYANKEFKFGRGRFFAATGDPDHAMAAWALNYSGLYDPNDQHIEDLMAAGRAEYDAQKRKAIYAEAQQYCMDTYYGIPLTFAYVTFAHRDYIEGFEFTPSNIPNLVPVKIK